MESQNIEFRAVIKFLTKEGAKAKEIHRRMADVYGDSSPKYSTVAKWSAEFKRGCDSLEGDPRPGPPADVISQEMIDRVERLVLNNRRLSSVPIFPIFSYFFRFPIFFLYFNPISYIFYQIPIFFKMLQIKCIDVQ